MLYADTNFLHALAFHTPRTAACAALLRRERAPVLVSELALMEARNVFARQAGDGVFEGEGWARLLALIESERRFVRLPMEWGPVSLRAGALMRQHAAALAAGTLDMLHVALALHHGAATFCSFDESSQARKLARAARLKLFPVTT